MPFRKIPNKIRNRIVMQGKEICTYGLLYTFLPLLFMIEKKTAVCEV